MKPFSTALKTIKSLPIKDPGGIFMSIKLVAIDIDGTLINDQRQITPPTVAAIN